MEEIKITKIERVKSFVRRVTFRLVDGAPGKSLG